MRKASDRRLYLGMPAVIGIAALLIILSTLFFTHTTRKAADETALSLSKFYLEEIADRTVYEINTVLENNTRQLQRAIEALRTEQPASEAALRSWLARVQQLNGLDIFAVVDEAGMVYTSDNTFSGISRFGFLSEPITETRVFTTRTSLSSAMVLIAMPTDQIICGDTHIVSCITGVDVDKIISAQQLQGVNNQVLCRLFNGSDGTCIVESDDQYANGRSIFDVLENDCSFSADYPLEQLINDWNAHTEGYSSYLSVEGTTYLYYKPVPGTDWMVSTRLREGVIRTQIFEANRHILHSSQLQLCIVILSMLAVLFFTIRQVRRVQAIQSAKEKEQEQQEVLKEALAQAEAANHAKTVFLNNMSHDIRTPMNAIIGFTNIALKEETSPDVRACLEKISESSDHLLTLINDVLDISRIESGKTKFHPTPVDITEVTDTVLDIMNGFLANRDLTFLIHRAALRAPYVFADAVRIREILVNILSNAVKFTPDGGTITFSFSQSPASDGQHILMHYQISDTGIGMSEEFQKHIFDEFSQEESSARTQYRGTGLGMSITKHYVDMMGGTILVESKKEVGTTFAVTLPLALADEAQVPKKTVSSVHTSLDGIHILLAEDNDLNAEIATVQLAEHGVQVTRAASGEEALAQFRQNPPGTFDLILMDIMMPVMNGYEATRAIRSTADHSDSRTIPIIAMTANAFAEDIQESLDAGMNAHLSKPIVADELIQKISENVRKPQKMS